MSRRERGEGSVFQSGGTWFARLELPPTPDGRRRSTRRRCRSRAEAIRVLRQLRLEQATQAAARPALPTADWLQHWLDTTVAQTCKPAGAQAYALAARRINSVLGAVALADLTPDHVRLLHTTLTRQGLAPATIASTHAALRRALNVAMREERIDRNVATMVPAPRVPKTPQDRLAADQCATLLAHPTNRDHPLYARWVLGLTIGARQGELLGLELDRINLDTGALTISRALQRLTPTHGCAPNPCGYQKAAYCPRARWPIHAWHNAEHIHGGLWLLSPKTESSIRNPYLDPTALAVVRAHVERYRPQRFLFEAAPGVPVAPRDDYAEWARALARAGLPAVSVHSMRRTAASVMKDAGVAAETRMEILGHVTLEAHERYAAPSARQHQAALSTVTSAMLADT